MKNLLKKTLRVVPVLSLAGTLSGCATMFCGTSEEVKIESFPPGASVFVNGENVGKTPLEVEMNRDSHPLVVLKKDGYADTRVQIKQEWNRTTMLNLLFFPGIPVGFPITGWIIDARSGATSEYTEDHVVVPVLTKDSLQNVYYEGNVKVSNLNPTPKMKALENSVREMLLDEVEKYIEPVWTGVRDPTTGRLSGRRHAKGIARMEVSVGDDGTILSYEVERYEGDSAVAEGGRNVFRKIKRKFVLPKKLRAVCPLSISVPVKYED